MTKEKCWVITYQGKYKRGLYTGQWQTRSQAIMEHTKDIGRTWEKCKREGDRCVRAVITY